MATWKLTNTAVKNAKPKAKFYRLSDGGGMYLQVEPNGRKYWRLSYRFGGKQKLLAFGVYPDVPLAGHKDKQSGTWIDGARDKREAARKLLAAGVDPSDAKRAEKVAAKGSDTFEAIAWEWFGKKKVKWAAENITRVENCLSRDILPALGSKRVNDVKAPQVLAALRAVESRGALETARKCKTVISGVMAYSVATGHAERNPVMDIRGAMQERQVRHHSSLTDPKQVAQLMRDVWEYDGFFVTQCAFKLIALLFVRPGELRNAEWSEFDLDGAEWRIPAGRMKMREQHLVPLSSQAVEILRELHQVTGRNRLVFPGVRSHDKPMSENTLTAALRYSGYSKDQMTSHGFRSTASTLLNEQGWNRDAIERQLAHAPRDSVRAAYNYAEFLPERRRMMQAWADYLDGLRTGAEVVPMKVQEWHGNAG